MHTFSTSLPLTLLQAPYAMTDTQGKWLVAFTVLLTIAVLIQTAVLGAMGFMVVKLLGKVTELTSKLETKVWPLMDSARDLVNDSVPKIKRVTTNIADTSDVYRAKIAEIDTFLSDTTEKAKRQTDRMDTMVSDALTTAGSAVGKVEHTVMSPFRQTAAVMAGIKASAEKLVENFSGTGKKRNTPKPVAFEGDSIYTGLEDDYHA